MGVRPDTCNVGTDARLTVPSTLTQLLSASGAVSVGSASRMRASWASAAQQMTTTRAKYVAPLSLRTKPVTVISRLSRVPAVSLATRSSTLGNDTTGARWAGSGGNGRRSTSVDTATTVGVAAPAPRAG